jgi:aryl-alcohol dehydrogenase-like predicted oxidoreductase
MTMEYTRLGETELEVSRIGLGTWQLGGEWGAVAEDEADATLRRALDMGINLFDTAQAYGFGASEGRVGRALRDEIRTDRDSVVLATKGGLRPQGKGIVRDAGAEWLREGLEASLEHLGTDHIDLYQVHWPDADTPAAETAEILQRFVDEGKVRYVGVSNYNARQMHELERHIKIDALQPPYHVFRREIEKHVLPYCEAHGIGTLVYGPIAHGLLGGKYDEDTTFDSDDWRSQSSAFSGEVFAHNLEVVERLKKFAFDRGVTVPQVAIGWVLAHPGVDVALVGARRPDQVDGIAEAGDLFLDAEDLEEIAELIDDAIEIGGATPEGVE